MQIFLTLCALAWIPTFCLSAVTPDTMNYPGAEPLSFFDKMTQYIFDPPSWVRKFYRLDALNIYTKERFMLPFHRFRSKPVTKSPSTTTEKISMKQRGYGAYIEQY